jgi:hypothetical protein
MYLSHYLSNSVSHEDVDEAIRISHSSKASLIDEEKMSNQEDVLGSIYSIIRYLSIYSIYQSILLRGVYLSIYLILTLLYIYLIVYISHYRDFLDVQKKSTVSFAQIEAMVLNRGYNTGTIYQFISIYQYLII